MYYQDMTTKAEPVSSGQSLNLHPLNDFVLVELKQASDKFSVKEAKYDSRTEGIVIEVPAEYGTYPFDVKAIVNKRVHFDQYNASEPIKRDGKQYGFIKIADIRGYED